MKAPQRKVLTPALIIASVILIGIGLLVILGESAPALPRHVGNVFWYGYRIMLLLSLVATTAILAYVARHGSGQGGPLRRGAGDKVLFGICSGLATYSGVSVSTVRIWAVVLTVMTGGGLIVVYIISRFTIPAEA